MKNNEIEENNQIKNITSLLITPFATLNGSIWKNKNIMPIYAKTKILIKRKFRIPTLRIFSLSKVLYIKNRKNGNRIKIIKNKISNILFSLDRNYSKIPL